MDAWGIISDFLQVLAAAGFPAATVTLRRQQLAHVARSLNRPPQDVDGDMLLAWFSRQMWALETRRSYRAACRRFWGWAHESGRVPTNAAAVLPPVAQPAAQPRPAPDDVWLAALQQADDRVRLMLRLAGELGLRRGEIARLHHQDVTCDASGAVLRVHGKGGKDRVVPLPDDLADAVSSCDGWVFGNRDGGHLSAPYVGWLIADALPGCWTAHTLRHRFASRAYRGSRNLRAVQTLLGHTSLATTQRYTAVDDGEVRAAMEAAK